MAQRAPKANQARTRIRRCTLTAPVGAAAKTSFSASIRLSPAQRAGQMMRPAFSQAVPARIKGVKGGT